MMLDAPAQFREQIQKAGLTPPEMIEPGKLHRFSSNGKRSDDAGWCKLFTDLAGGVYGDHRTGMYEVWQATRERHFSPAEREVFRERCEQERREREAEEARTHAEAAAKAVTIWKAADPGCEDHPYIVRKGVRPVPTLREIHTNKLVSLLGYTPKSRGEPLSGRVLVVPVKVNKKLSTAELIDEAGRKSAIAGGSKGGGFWAAQPLPDGDGEGLTLLIGEGVATVLSGKAATNHPAVAALSSGNLPAVAKAMRECYPAAALVILADLEKVSGDPNSHAIEAARSVDGMLAVPAFGTDRPESATDFNDLAQHQGVEAVRRAIAAATVLPLPSSPDSTEAPAAGLEGWPEPLPLSASFDAMPYPLEALPGTLGKAVREVVDFVQCPPPLAACSALAVVSMSAQGLVDVRRDERLSGPASLFFLAIAESGERKTSVDAHFASSLREWEAEQRELMKADIAQAMVDTDTWKAKRKAAERNLEETAKAGKPTGAHEDALRDLELNKPSGPLVPRLVYGDVTPESLLWKLANDWPSGGVLSSEAGIVFGAHGMRSESVMSNLSQLNVLWDGGTLSVDRKTSDSFTVSGARLTMGLAVQPETVRQFFERTKGLARGSGFAARFLIAWPESTQGQRLFRSAPDTWPHLAAFHRRVRGLLDQPLNMPDGRLQPFMLDLSPEAKRAWVQFHDDIERELAAGGELADIRDVASKAADNAARLAALFHLFEAGPTGMVSVEAMNAAARITTWHVYEARRFLGEIALPIHMVNAAKVDTWLIAECQKRGTLTFSRRDLQRYITPTALRDGKRLDEALRELREAGRIREADDGRKKLILVNPALTEVARVAA